MLLLIIGIVIAVILSVIWDQYFYGVLDLSDCNYPFCVLEHYHVGLIVAIISLFTPIINELLQGLSLYLIIDERWQDNPFGLGKDYQWYCIELAVVLLAILIIFFIIL